MTGLSDKDFELRKGRVTGTMVAQILNLHTPPWEPVHKYSGPLTAWIRLQDIAEPIPDNPAMRFGRAVEDVIRRWYEEDTGNTVYEVGTQVKGEHYGVTSDGEIANPEDVIKHVAPTSTEGGYLKLKKGAKRGIFEAKTANTDAARYWGKPGTDEIPRFYVPQVCWEMFVCDASYADISVMHTNSVFHYHMERDDELIELMKKHVDNFIEDYVLTGKEPPDSHVYDVRDYLNFMYPDFEKQIIESNEVTHGLVAQYQLARYEAERWKEQQVEAELELKRIIGNNWGIKTDNYSVTWSIRNGRQYLSEEKLIEAGLNPDDYKVTGKPYRVFMVRDLISPRPKPGPKALKDALQRV